MAGASAARILQLGVFCLGLLQDENVRIGVLPRFQESLVGLLCGGFIAHHLLRAAKLEPGQWAGDKPQGQTRIIDQLLELSGS